MLLCLLICASSCLFDLFFFKQKTAYEMRISDWSSDVCSSDLRRCARGTACGGAGPELWPPPLLPIPAPSLPPMPMSCGHSPVADPQAERTTSPRRDRKSVV